MYLNTENLMEKVVSKENMTKAYKKVLANKGSAGIDGITVEEVLTELWDKWDTIKAELAKGGYEPNPVRRVQIPKPDGSKRNLGIPTVMDRIIQQAIYQILSPIYEEVFSENSYGFRPNKSAHQAIAKAKSYITEGYNIVVDIDLEKFFDRVNQDKLMYRLCKDIADKNLLRQINKFLKAGVMINGVYQDTNEGTPQGGNLSPLLSNIVLDELDKLLESRGLRFVRYADDCNIYVKSYKAGERVMNNVVDYLENKMKLRVNRDKSAVDRPSKRKFLGVTIAKMAGKGAVYLSKKALEKIKYKIRELTNRNTSISIEIRLQKLKLLVKGWVNYFKIASAKQHMEELDEWTRRRIRACIWKQWKTIGNRHKQLVKLGADDNQAWQFANTRKGYWRISNSPIMSKTCTNKYLENLGYVSFSSCYLK